MAGLQKQVRSIPTGAKEHGEIVSSGLKVRYAFAPGTSLPDAAALQLYSFLEKSCLQRKNHPIPAVVESNFLCFKWKSIYGSKNSLLAQNLELWLLGTSKNN